MYVKHFETIFKQYFETTFCKQYFSAKNTHLFGDSRRRRTESQNKDKSRFIEPILVFFQKSRQNSSSGSQSGLVSMGYHQEFSETSDPDLERFLEFLG